MGSQPPAIYRFGLFEVDSRTGEVRKSGVKIKLQDQPLQVLLRLLEQPGSIVTREELRSALWHDGTFVDFDAGLNTAIRRLRDTLGDSADNPTLIETIPRRGYRFIAPVDVTTPEPGSSIPPPETTAPARSSRRFLWLSLAVVGVLLVGLLLLLASPSPPTGDPLRFTQITHDGVAKSGPLLSDGTRIYFTEPNPTTRLMVQVAATGGEVTPTEVSEVFRNARACALSRDGTQMLVLSGKGELPLPLWMIPLAGGSPRKIGPYIANDAAWCPDPDRLLYAEGHQIFMIRQDGTEPKKLVTVPGFAGGLCWSPDGSRLRFHVWDPSPASLAIWEVAADGTGLHRVFPASSGLGSPSSGVWNLASNTFYFQASSEDRTDIWAVPPRRAWLPWSSASPIRLTSGPLSFSAPAVNPANPKELFVIGTSPRAELVRFDSSTGRFLPYLGGISAEGVDFSRDGSWAAYTAYPGGELWRCRIDGTERRQLTFPPMRAFLPRWSTDGGSIAFVDVSEEPWTIRITSSSGTGLRQVSPPGQAASDPTWSPSGDRLAYGGVDLTHADNPSKFAIQVLDLASGRITTLPGSTGVFSPRWSPDGRYMAAINSASELTILDLAGSNTFTLSGYKVGFPSWSRGGEFLYFQDRTHTELPGQILRLNVATRKVETVVELEAIGRLPLGTFASWTGLAPDDAPLLSRDTSVQEIYSIRW